MKRSGQFFLLPESRFWKDIRPFQINHAFGQRVEAERQTGELPLLPPDVESFTPSSVLSWQGELPDLAVSLIFAAAAL